VRIRSIKTQLTLAVAAIVLFFTTLLVLLSYGLLRDMAHTHAEEMADTILTETDKHISRFFRDMEELARSFRAYPAVYQVEVPRLKQVILATVGARRSYMRAIYLGTESGEMYEWGYGEGLVDNVPSFPADYDPRKRPWYRKALERRDFAISDPYLYASVEALGITCVIPVHHPDGRFVGVLGLDIMLDDLQRLVEELEIGMRGKALLLDREGKPLVNQFGSQGSSLPDFATPGQSTAASPRKQFNALHDGRHYLISGTRNELTGWTLFIGLPREEVMATTDRYISLGIAVDLLLMILLLLALEGSGRRLLIEPVEHMVRIISRIRDGEGRARMALERGDEFGMLARSFDRLADQVEEYAGEMERKVRERTRRLNALQQENTRLRIIEEKERIYSYLHDSLGARLTNINISNNVAISAAERSPELLRDMQERIEENARAGLADLKEILAGSMSPGRRVFDVRTLLELQVRRRLEMKRIAFQFDGDEEALDLLAPSLAYEVEKLLQELVSNVLKHAEAERVELAAHADNRELHLHFKDDGRGFDPETMGEEGFGLHGLQRRIGRLGGVLRVVSRRGAGTLVEVRLPLQKERGDGGD
jgi:methyl-accepting chemotaxis protein